MLEILVRPYRDSNVDLVNQSYALLVTHPGIQWIELSLSIADQAARIWAEHNLRTPEAIQAATALQLSATGFLANDALFKGLQGLDVFILNDFAGQPIQTPCEIAPNKWQISTNGGAEPRWNANGKNNKKESSVATTFS